MNDVEANDTTNREGEQNNANDGNRGIYTNNANKQWGQDQKSAADYGGEWRECCVPGVVFGHPRVEHKRQHHGCDNHKYDVQHPPPVPPTGVLCHECGSMMTGTLQEIGGDFQGRLYRGRIRHGIWPDFGLVATRGVRVATMLRPGRSGSDATARALSRSRQLSICSAVSRHPLPPLQDTARLSPVLCARAKAALPGDAWSGGRSRLPFRSAGNACRTRSCPPRS
jgi:hypothetical protein